MNKIMDRRSFLTEAITFPFVFSNLDLLTKQDKGYRAIILKADYPNSNKRIYLKKILQDVVQKFNLEYKQCLEVEEKVCPRRLISLTSYRPIMPSSSGLLGQMGIPTDAIIHFRKVSHEIYNIFLDEDDFLKADIKILSTPYGEILKKILRDKSDSFVFRPRGVGSSVVADEHGNFIIEDYKLITIDALPVEEACVL